MISDETLRRTGASDRVVRLYGDLVRTAATFVVLLAIVLLCAYHAAGVRMMASTLGFNDFGKFYYSAALALQGRDMYGPSPATSMPFGPHERREFLNMNPPHFHLLILPLTRLSLPDAFVVWSLLGVACLVGGIMLIARELQFEWTVSRVFVVGLACLAAAPTATTIVTGQVSFLLMLPATAAWLAARRGHRFVSACLLGLLASLKPFLGLFLLHFLVRKKWSAAAVFTATGAAAAIAGVVVFGAAAFGRWIAALSAVEWTWAVMNGSIHGILARGLAPNPFLVPLDPSVAFAGSIIGGVLSTLGLGLALRYADDGVDSTFAILIVAALLFSPLGWIYYLWLAVGPLTALAGRILDSRTRHGLFGWLALLGLLLPLQWVFAGVHTRFGSVSLGSAYGWAMLFLWLAVVLARRTRNGPGPREARATPSR